MLFTLLAITSTATADLPESTWLDDEVSGQSYFFEEDEPLRYLPGAETALLIEGLGFDGGEGWLLRSQDESIFRLDRVGGNEDDLWAEGYAEAEGETLLFVERGDEQHAFAVSVAAPDRIELTVPILDDASVEETPLLVVQGEVTFELAYYREGERLYGAGQVKAAPVEGLEVSQQIEVRDGRHDRLTLYASALGDHEVALRLHGASLGALPMTVVGPDTIVELALREPGGLLQEEALAVALDSRGAPIYGAAPRWWYRNLPQGRGERFVYWPQDEAPERELIARFDGHEATTTIRAWRGRAGSSSAGCAAAGGAAGTAPALLALLALLRRFRSASVMVLRSRR